MDCMNGRLFVAAFLILIMNDLRVSSRAPTILPELNFVYVLESQPFKLTCIAEETSSVVWKRGGRTPAVIGDEEGFTISNKVVSSNEMTTITSTLSKATARADDSNFYRCADVTTSLETLQKVTVFKAVVKNSVYNETNGTATLGCSVSDIDPRMYTIHWEFMGKRLTTDTKYTIRNGNIDIQDPVPADGGEYFCVYTFSDGNQVSRMSALLVVPRTSDAQVTSDAGVVYPLNLLPYFLYLLIMHTR